MFWLGVSNGWEAFSFEVVFWEAGEPISGHVSAVVEWRAVDLRYGERWVFEGFSLRVEEGERLVIRGASGRGKTSLFRLLLGFERLDGGGVFFGGEEVGPESVWRLRREVVYVPQRVELGQGTVRDKVAGILGFRANRGIAMEVGEFERLGLTADILDRGTAELSGGERQRVGLALGLMMGRKVLLLDEPTAALDEDSRKLVRRRIDELSGNYTVIVIAHDEAWAEGARVVEL